jgi:L-fuculose-phosphate aldolase
MSTDMTTQLVQALTMLEREGIIDFNGHFSARLPDGRGLLINAGDSVRSDIGAADFVEVGFDGRSLVEGARTPPMEFHLHAQIYLKRPDVQAVVHAHPNWSSVLTTAGHGWEPVTMQATVLGRVRTFPKIASINSAELGKEVAEFLGDAKAALLDRHGMVAVASSIPDAFTHAIYLEESAHRQYLALQVGQPRPLSDEECDRIGRNLSRPWLLKKVWDYHFAKHLGKNAAELTPTKR